MGYKNREIEAKMLVEGVTKMNDVVKLLNAVYDEDRCERIIVGASKDVYFVPPVGAKADFMRVRFGASKSDQSYFTIKWTDKDDNLDRVEKDVPISDPKLMCDTLTDLHGPAKGEIHKRYKVYFLSTEHDTISVYQIKNDDRVFVEIEATTEAKMNKFLAEVQKVLPYNLTRSTKSLFQLFLGDTPIQNIRPTFEEEVRKAINGHSMENGSDTPDFLLAEYLSDCLATWNKTVRKREEWYGRNEPRQDGLAR
jgi:hypothetical protein